MKKILLKLYYFGNLSKKSIETNQAKIRDLEWNSILNNIQSGSKFLDVGCGAGYALKRAFEDKNCKVFGIDPDPGAHGVGRYSSLNKNLNITQGIAESLPYEDNMFDVVYSSHVLEHVTNEKNSLIEMSRVLKPNGTLIIGMPTSNMAWINFFTQILFTSHHRLINFLFSPFKSISTGKAKFINVFVPMSHSASRAKTIFYDIKHYRVKKWQKTVQEVFKIENALKPAFYPYPEYLQLFKTNVNSHFSSSVFFICKVK